MDQANRDDDRSEFCKDDLKESCGDSDKRTVHHIAAAGWRSPLAIFVTWLLVIESVTGLWVYLAPFFVFSEVQLLVHVVAGLAMEVPYLVYQVRHFLTWYRQKPSVVMVLGYLLMGMVLVCLISGCLLTFQAAQGPKRSAFWDLTHVVSGIGTAILVLVHVPLAFVRRRQIAMRMPAFRQSLIRFLRDGFGWSAIAVAVIVLGTAIYPNRPVEFAPPADYGLSDYIEQFDEYRGNPFAPTYARTVNGTFVDPNLLAHSKSCGSSGCHEQIYREWLPSAHRFSAMNPPFQQVQKNFAVDRNPAETRYCAGCHDPISLFAGARDIQDLDLSSVGTSEGCSCVACHSISKVDQRGNGDYVLTPPRKYLWENTEGWRKFVSDFLIRAYPQQHLADYDRSIQRSPEFCGACHKQFIPEALNRFGLSSGQNQYDQWRKSHWHADDPQTNLSCIDCHMRLVPNSSDPGRGEGGDPRRSPDDRAHRHHGTIATNMFMPQVLKLPYREQHVALTKQWIRGETVIPEIADVWPKGPVASLRILGPKQVRPGQKVRLRVVVVNRKAGHNLTTGPLDFTRAWIHLRVVDRTGKTLAEWGAIDPKSRRITDTRGQVHKIGNSRKEGTLVLEAEPLDQNGNPLRRHELWKKAGGRGGRVIFPGHSDNQIYQFTVPDSGRGKLSVLAELNFRRYRQEFLDLVVPDMERETGVYQPMVTQSSDRLEMTIGKAPAG